MPDGSVGQVGSAVGAVQGAFGGSMVGVGAGVSGLGGGFEFSPEELDAVIHGWEDLLAEFQGDQQHIREMVRMLTPPAEDAASVGFVDAVRAALTDLQESNKSMVTYAEDYLAKLNAAKSGNEEVELAHSDAVASFLASMDK